MADYKCKKIIIADGQGGADSIIELGGDVDSGDITWKHGDISETPTLEARANDMWEIWKPGRNVIHSGSSVSYGDIIQNTAILSGSPLVYNDDVDDRTNVQGSYSFAVGNLNYVGASSSGVIGTNNYLSYSNSSINNGLIVGENCSADNETYNFILNGKGLEIESLNSNSLCILGRYNAYDSSGASINSINTDTLLVIGKGSDDSDRNNVLKVDTNRIMTSCSEIIFSNLAQGVSIFNGDYNPQELLPTDPHIISMTFKHNTFAITEDYATIDQSTQEVVQQQDVLTSIQGDKIKTKTIVAQSIDFDFNMADGKAPDFMTIEGRCGAGVLDDYMRCFVSGDYTTTDGTKFRIRPITANTYYPIGVLTAFASHRDNNSLTNINDRPKVIVSGFCWVRMNIGPTVYQVGSFCQIDVGSENGGMILYDQTSSNSPTFNRYWRIIGKKNEDGYNLALIQLDQFFCK